jgi:dipeptidyl aminopeptidase/acylaminoacyl peptidase
MNKVLSSALGISLFLFWGIESILWAQSLAVSPSDCVRVRYITGLWLSRNGKQVAYLLKTPNIEQNRNDFQLFVRSVEDNALSPRKLLLTGAAMSDLTWLNDDKRIAVLIKDSTSDKKRLVLLDVLTGRAERFPDIQGTIDSYSIDASGTTLAYTVPDAVKADENEPGMSKEDIANGYRITPGPDATNASEIRSLYILHRNSSGAWSAPALVTVENPFTHRKTIHLPFARSLSMSPNGKRLLFEYFSDDIPEEWRKDPVMKPFVDTDQLDIMVLYNVDTANTTLAFNALYPASTPLWSNDSRSFLVNSPSPSGSRWQAEDVQDHRASPADANLFLVKVDSGDVEEVFRHVPSHHEGPLAWRPDGDVILRVGAAAVVRLHRSGDSWQEAERTNLAQSEKDQFTYLVSNGAEILGTHETVTTPPELFEYHLDEKRFHLLTDLNPELSKVQFAAVESVHWVTSGGLNVFGLLFLPPNYNPKKRYPLVIQTKGDGEGAFVCDSGLNHDPSFAPQPIATAGIMYLVRTVSDDWRFQDDLDNRPKGYPGGIGEAVQQMDIWDSAVEMLNKKEMIDPSKVGIIGFSRTGWQVEFDLVHARTRYVAATAADNVMYGLSNYWLDSWASDDAEQMYGGPPYGESLENWRKYSLSFNIQDIHTPLLIEVMGYGAREDLPFKWPGKWPGNLLNYYEIRKGLSRLGKPFEMYYYPDEQHQPDHPKARVASLQRNVDWFRFWLQDYEDSTPAKREQYERWRALKKLHKADLAVPIVSRH